ncbi:hypothetical protein GDO86_019788 [Hymenochirus boettgeri]|uniref:G-protein coupled receptors family 1 profile domain-containing protein n=1 Tax=Hymenochirus boettgeri TaxID=247094 RepID=A0A8T2IHB9_9PIPI|nr:hypothetical protein GDO86_019788 [Hymenochirus boettgeri]
MCVANASNCSTIFIFGGVSGLEDIHFWIGFPLLFMYLLAVFGNVIILYIIKLEKDLHEPMYIFLSMLSALILLLSQTPPCQGCGDLLVWVHRDLV